MCLFLFFLACYVQQLMPPCVCCGLYFVIHIWKDSAEICTRYSLVLACCFVAWCSTLSNIVPPLLWNWQAAAFLYNPLVAFEGTQCNTTSIWLLLHGMGGLKLHPGSMCRLSECARISLNSGQPHCQAAALATQATNTATLLRSTVWWVKRFE